MIKKIITITLLFFFLTSFSQKAPFKFGKLSEDEFNIKSCSFYPEAQAMILGNYGILSFKYNDHKNRWNYEMEVIERKKIFSKSEKDAGNVKLKIYSPDDGGLEEKLTLLKGYTYNTVDGKLVKIKLDKSDIYENRINDYWTEVSFAFPDVQEGSVLEYTYMITSDFITNLRTWHFQDDIPTAYSEFIYTIPEFFDYQISQEGTYIALESTDDQRNESFPYSWQSGPQIGGSVQKGKSAMTSISSQRRLIAKNILPVIEEPFMNNRINQPARIEFQLSSYEMPGQLRKYVAGNYDKFNAELLDRSSFGGRLKEGGFAKKKIEEFSSKSDQERMLELYTWTQRHYTWNGYSGFTSGETTRKIFNDQEGSVAAINLSFIAACREAGFDINPVILSTRGNGIPHPLYPSYDRFNYVICILNMDDKVYFLDPSADLPFGQLSIKCRNGKGWMVSESGGRWVDLKSNSSYESSILISLKIDEEQLKGTIQCKEDGYLAINTLSQYQKNGEEKYFKNKEDNYEDWSFENPNVEEMKWGNPVKYSFEISQDLDDENIIYLSPLMTGVENENPFKREERMSNVDIPYTIKKIVISQIEIPENFVAELPKSSAIALPDNMGTYTYSANQIGQNIQITSIFRLNNADFTTLLYPTLKQFYELMVNKNNEVVVLKKI